MEVHLATWNQDVTKPLVLSRSPDSWEQHYSICAGYIQHNTDKGS